MVRGTEPTEAVSRTAYSSASRLADDPELGRPVVLHPLTFLEDNGEVVVGRTDIDSYGVFPPDGAELLRQLASGMSPALAAHWYAGAYGQQVDIAEFLDTLGELEFLGGPDPAAARPVRWQSLGRYMFCPAAFGCYLLVITAAVAVMVTRPRLAPHPGNIVFTHYVTVLTVGLFLGQIPVILLHESFHMLAGRRLGLRTSLRIGRRLYFLVFETTMDGLVAVPRRQRYLPMLAGMLADLLVIAVLTLIGAATMQPDGSVPLVGGICLAVAFTTVFRFAWQFYVYLRTDLYYVVVTALGCLDLHAAAQRILVNRVRRLLHRPLADESALHPRDRAVGRWYSWLMLAGYAFSLTTLAVAVVPVVWQVLVITFQRFVHHGVSWGQIADSVLFLVLNLAQIAVVFAVVLRSHLRKRTLRQPHLALESRGIP